MKLRIESILKENGISKAKLAKMMGANPSSVNSIINGNPTIGTLEKVASSLGVRFIDLFEKEDPVINVEIDGEDHKVNNNITINIKRK
ncbi:MAG: helix-turn-helix transcriptional regulator [Muribaculaceae bacterium]